MKPKINKINKIKNLSLYFIIGLFFLLFLIGTFKEGFDQCDTENGFSRAECDALNDQGCRFQGWGATGKCKYIQGYESSITTPRPPGPLNWYERYDRCWGLNESRCTEENPSFGCEWVKYSNLQPEVSWCKYSGKSTDPLEWPPTTQPPTTQ